MDANPQRLKDQDDVTSALNEAVETLTLAEKRTNVAAAKAVFKTVGTFLATIRDSAADEPDYVELGLFCADICQTLDRGTRGTKMDDLNKSVREAINRLALIVADIHGKIVKWGRRNAVSRRFHIRNDKETIATWRLDLDKILRVLNKEFSTSTTTTIPTTRDEIAVAHTTASGIRNSAANTPTSIPNILYHMPKSPQDTHTRTRIVRTTNTATVSEWPLTVTQGAHASAPGESLAPLPRNTHGTTSDIRQDVLKTRAMVSDIHRDMLKIQDELHDQHGPHSMLESNVSGESPPLPPRAFFGRDGLIEKIVDLAENFVPIALIGVGGIGKTSIALTVLHHDRIKRRFGDNRRFIRCDKFPTSRAHLLRQLSHVIGAGIENPKDLARLIPFLSLKEMIIVLDNAESILDPEGTDAQEIYAMVEELSRFNNICICLTSRISTIPPECRHFSVPTLSMEAAHDTFYRIYDKENRSDLVEGILKQLDFHPLSITLLAAVAQQNTWSTDRLVREWEKRRTKVLRTRHQRSLAATIELSLASPMFQELGPDARALLGVVAFFPQGVHENNIDQLFPTIAEGIDILDEFCILSLTYRSGGFVTMLAPLRDYLSPEDPKSSPLLCTAKDHYFARLSVDLDPNEPNFGEAQWITREDVNVEHLLNVFTTIDANSDDVWNACAGFVSHLYWHKRQQTVLGHKIEGLPDDHPWKPQCLYRLSELLGSVGNFEECRRLLVHTLKLNRELKDDHGAGCALRHLSHLHRRMGLPKEGIQMAEGALEIFKRIGNEAELAQGLIELAWLLHSDNQLDAAEETVSRAIDLIPEAGDHFQVYRSHRILGEIYQSKGDPETAIYHFEEAVRIATAFSWRDYLFDIHAALALLLLGEGRSDHGQTHVEHALSHSGNNAYHLGGAMLLRAALRYEQHRFDEARSEVLGALDVYEKLGAAKDAEGSRNYLRLIQGRLDGQTSDRLPWETSEDTTTMSGFLISSTSRRYPTLSLGPPQRPSTQPLSPSPLC